MSADLGLPRLPPRAVGAHKGQCGDVLVLAGSVQYPGAAVLAARSVLRGGAGLVTLGCPAAARPLIASQLLGEMSCALPSDDAGGFASQAAPQASALASQRNAAAIGPGLGRSDETVAFARTVAVALPVPTVVDADALNALAGRIETLAAAAAPRVLTPHPGEAARLLDRAIADIATDRREAATTLAVRAGSVVILKGAGTIVTDGTRLHVSTTGNPGMATAGSGDVLTGLVAALLAQGLAAYDAAVLGAHVHGRAGDLAAADVGERGMIAADLIPRLAIALRELD